MRYLHKGGGTRLSLLFLQTAKRSPIKLENTDYLLKIPSPRGGIAQLVRAQHS